MSNPQKGQIYKHYKGGLYRVEGIGKRDDSDPRKLYREVFVARIEGVVPDDYAMVYNDEADRICMVRALNAMSHKTIPDGPLVVYSRCLDGEWWVRSVEAWMSYATDGFEHHNIERFLHIDTYAAIETMTLGAPVGKSDISFP